MQWKGLIFCSSINQVNAIREVMCSLENQQNSLAYRGLSGCVFTYYSSLDASKKNSILTNLRSAEARCTVVITTNALEAGVQLSIRFMYFSASAYHCFDAD